MAVNNAISQAKYNEQWLFYRHTVILMDIKFAFFWASQTKLWNIFQTSANPVIWSNWKALIVSAV